MTSNAGAESLFASNAGAASGRLAFAPRTGALGAAVGLGAVAPCAPGPLRGPKEGT